MTQTSAPARVRALLLVFGALATANCHALGIYTSSMDSFMERGMRRAMYELTCPRDQLQVNDLGNGTIGVNGCGKQAIYKEVSGAGWVNNSVTKAQ